VRNGVIVQDLITPHGDHVVYIMTIITLPNTDKEIENLCQDIIAGMILKSGMGI